MAKQTLNDGETGLVIRGKINDNFTELYARSTGIVAKAKVNFASDGTITLVGATNVASVTRVGAGNFEVTFTSAIPADCVCLMNGRFGDVSSEFPLLILAVDHEAGKGLTTTKFQFHTVDQNTAIDPYSSSRANSWVYFEIKDPTAF